MAFVPARLCAPLTGVYCQFPDLIIHQKENVFFLSVPLSYGIQCQAISGHPIQCLFLNQALKHYFTGVQPRSWPLLFSSCVLILCFVLLFLYWVLLLCCLMASTDWWHQCCHATLSWAIRVSRGVEEQGLDARFPVIGVFKFSVNNFLPTKPFSLFGQ